MRRTVIKLICLMWTGLAVVVNAATHTLTVQSTGNGYVTCNPTNGVYPHGATVVLTAVPSEEWYFDRWSGDLSGGTNPATVYMDNNKAIEAIFLERPIYTLMAQSNGLGSVQFAPAGGSYRSNKTVTCTAIPSAGWRFLNWSGAGSGSNSSTVVSVNTNSLIVANFVQYPAIIRELQDARVPLGQTGILDVDVQGTPPLYFKWFFQGKLINDATNSSLTLSNVRGNNAGYYQVIITNNYGSITSRTALLTVSSSCSGTNTVETATDQSLRAAIARGGLVRFCCNGTITLSNQIDITKDVIVDATGNEITISGNNAVRLFRVNPGVSFTISNACLADGQTNASKLPPTDERACGAAIYNNGGHVAIFHCRITNNSVFYDYRTTQGAAVFNDGGTLLIESSICSSIITRKVGVGGFLLNTNGAVFINNCVLEYNTSGLGGGAILQDSGRMVISNTTLRMNQAYVLATYRKTATYPSPGMGGAIYIYSGTLDVVDCVFNGNGAYGGSDFMGAGSAYGGAIYSLGTINLSGTSIISNVAYGKGATFDERSGEGCGGGIYNKGTMSMNQCLVAYNAVRGSGPYAYGAGAPGLGGGLFSAAPCFVTNITICSNMAQGGGYAFYSNQNASAYGGGVYNQSSLFEGVNITVAGNYVTNGNNSLHETKGDNIGNSNGVVHLLCSLLSGSVSNGNAWGPIADDGYNMCSDMSAQFSNGSSWNNTDPLLLPLADNGGLTMTMALSSNSPAIGWGPSSGAPEQDQRGYPRPFRNKVDLGAYQTAPVTPPISISLCWSNQSLLLGFVAQSNTVYQLQGGIGLPNPSWTTIETMGHYPFATNVTRVIITTAQQQFYQVVTQ